MQRSEHHPECQSSGTAQLLFETGSLSLIGRELGYVAWGA